MNTNLSLILALLLALNCLVSSKRSKEFCEEFRNNNQRISYTFTRDFSERNKYNTTTHDIVIKGHYWRLYFHPLNHSLTFVDRDRQSKQNPFFSDHYSMAVCVRLNKLECNALLFSKTNWRHVEVLNISRDDFWSEKELSEFKPAKNVTVLPTAAVTPSFAFTYHFEKHSYLVLVEKLTNGSLKPIVLMVYEDLGMGFEASPPPFDAFKQVPTRFDVIAIMPQIMDIKRKSILGIIFLLKDDTSIRYMWCSSEKCEFEAVPRLVNCSAQKTDVSSAPKVSSDLSLSVIFGIILIFVVIIIVIAVLFYMKRIKPKTKTVSKNKKFGPKIRTTTSSTLEPNVPSKSPKKGSPTRPTSPTHPPTPTKLQKK